MSSWVQIPSICSGQSPVGTTRGEAGFDLIQITVDGGADDGVEPRHDAVHFEKG